MDRLSHVILFTGDVAGMRRFYENPSGLTVRQALGRVGGVRHRRRHAGAARHARCRRTRGIQLRFATDDIEARVRELAGRGVRLDPPGIETLRLGPARPPRGIPRPTDLTLWQPKHAPYAPGSGPRLSVVINCRDLPATKAFYQDALGFHGLDRFAVVGASCRSARPAWDSTRASSDPGAEQHHARDDHHRPRDPRSRRAGTRRRASGASSSPRPPTRPRLRHLRRRGGSGWQRDHASATCPSRETLEEQLAEPFEDEAAPHRAAIRKPVKKRVTGREPADAQAGAPGEADSAGATAPSARGRPHAWRRRAAPAPRARARSPSARTTPSARAPNRRSAGSRRPSGAPSSRRRRRWRPPARPSRSSGRAGRARRSEPSCADREPGR